MPSVTVLSQGSLKAISNAQSLLELSGLKDVLDVDMGMHNLSSFLQPKAFIQKAKNLGRCPTESKFKPKCPPNPETHWIVTCICKKYGTSHRAIAYLVCLLKHLYSLINLVGRSCCLCNNVGLDDIDLPKVLRHIKPLAFPEESYRCHRR